MSHTAPFVRSRPARRSASVVVALGVGLALAACGGQAPPATSTSASQAPKDGTDAAYKYADCMRSHGVASFPDPKVTRSGNSVKVAMMVPASLGNSPAFKSASKACDNILPAPATPAQEAIEQRAHRHALLAFAHCLRGHGFANFPDPDAQGNLHLSTVTAAGVDIQAPSFLTAAKACVGVTHGMITAAQIEQGVHAGASGS